VGVVDFARTGNVLKWALKSAGFCKIYYSHIFFELIIFLSKNQNHSKKLSNYGSMYFKNSKEKPVVCTLKF
jgi:hypothetical protein